MTTGRDRQAGDDECLFQLGNCRAFQRAAIQAGPFSPRGKKHFVVNRIKDRPDDHFSPTF